MDKATLSVSACFFGDGILELTWEKLDTGKKATLTTQVNKKTGMDIINVVSPCVYHKAVNRDHLFDEMVEALKKNIQRLYIYRIAIEERQAWTGDKHGSCHLIEALTIEIKKQEDLIARTEGKKVKA